MHLLLKHKLLIAVVTLLAAGSGGIAYAATQSSSSNPRRAFLNDVAKRLGVSPAKLESAFKAALVDRLNAEVKAGQITQAQANRIEQRLERGGPPPFFFAPRGRLRMLAPGRLMPGPLFPGPLGSAASYLGLGDIALLKDLASGKSMAQLAKAHGKSVSGLEQAIISAETTQLKRLAANGIITTKQEQRMLSALSRRVGKLVNRTGFPRLRLRLGPPALMGSGPVPQAAPLIATPAPPPLPAGPPSGGFGPTT